MYIRTPLGPPTKYSHIASLTLLGFPPYRYRQTLTVTHTHTTPHYTTQIDTGRDWQKKKKERKRKKKKEEKESTIKREERDQEKEDKKRRKISEKGRKGENTGKMETKE